MKILYGVQGTGNGHITRARSIAVEMEQAGIDVDFIFTGRSRDKLFNMEPFGDYRWYRGLTFATKKGKILRFKTVLGNNLFQFVRDIISLNLDPYDLVITDFEPVTAWAAYIRRKRSIGIGHQYAFKYDIPVSNSDPISRLIMKLFAPAQLSLGFHWHHFNKPILPPVIEPVNHKVPRIPNKILVYLAFNETDDVVKWLSPMTHYEFYIYCQTDRLQDKNHIHLRPFSRDGFLNDLASCSGVITNAGFELLSEAMQAGKKLLVIPLKGQMEQTSNALALKQLGYGDAIEDFNQKHLGEWLEKPSPSPILFPNVAKAIVQWIKSGMSEDETQLSTKLWEQIPAYRSPSDDTPQIQVGQA